MDSLQIQLRRDIVAARLYVSHTLHIGALTAFAPFASELEFVLETHPDALATLGLDEDWDNDIDIAVRLAQLGRLGWLIGAQRPVVMQGGVGVLGAVYWFYGETYEIAMQLAINWARAA
jgi:hypothetical protein